MEVESPSRVSASINVALSSFERYRANNKLERENIQKRTFTRWINGHVDKVSDLVVNDLYTDLADGKVLKTLLEVLSGKILPPLRNDTMGIYCLENLHKIMMFLEGERIHLENIQPLDIYGGNPDLILGLIWIIILSYQVETKDDSDSSDSLLHWCQLKTAKYLNVNVMDFTTSWQDGLAFNALIHCHRPDLVDYDKLMKYESLHNITSAFLTAEHSLGVPSIIDPADVARADSRSVMTYVSSLYRYFSQHKEDDVSMGRLINILRENRQVEESIREFGELVESGGDVNDVQVLAFNINKRRKFCPDVEVGEEGDYDYVCCVGREDMIRDRFRETKEMMDEWIQRVETRLNDSRLVELVGDEIALRARVNDTLLGYVRVVPDCREEFDEYMERWSGLVEKLKGFEGREEAEGADLWEEMVDMKDWLGSFSLSEVRDGDFADWSLGEIEEELGEEVPHLREILGVRREKIRELAEEERLVGMDNSLRQQIISIEGMDPKTYEETLLLLKELEGMKPECKESDLARKFSDVRRARMEELSSKLGIFSVVKDMARVEEGMKTLPDRDVFGDDYDRLSHLAWEMIQNGRDVDGLVKEGMDRMDGVYSSFGARIEDEKGCMDEGVADELAYWIPLEKELLMSAEDRVGLALVERHVDSMGEKLGNVEMREHNVLAGLLEDKKRQNEAAGGVEDEVGMYCRLMDELSGRRKAALGRVIKAKFNHVGDGTVEEDYGLGQWEKWLSQFVVSDFIRTEEWVMYKSLLESERAAFEEEVRPGDGNGFEDWVLQSNVNSLRAKWDCTEEWVGRARPEEAGDCEEMLLEDELRIAVEAVKDLNVEAVLEEMRNYQIEREEHQSVFEKSGDADALERRRRNGERLEERIAQLSWQLQQKQLEESFDNFVDSATLLRDRLSAEVTSPMPSQRDYRQMVEEMETQWSDLAGKMRESGQDGVDGVDSLMADICHYYSQLNREEPCMLDESMLGSAPVQGKTVDESLLARCVYVNSLMDRLEVPEWTEDTVVNDILVERVKDRAGVIEGMVRQLSGEVVESLGSCESQAQLLESVHDLEGRWAELQSRLEDSFAGMCSRRDDVGKDVREAMEWVALQSVVLPLEGSAEDKYVWEWVEHLAKIREEEARAGVHAVDEAIGRAGGGLGGECEDLSCKFGSLFEILERNKEYVAELEQKSPYYYKLAEYDFFLVEEGEFVKNVEVRGSLLQVQRETANFERSCLGVRRNGDAFREELGSACDFSGLEDLEEMMETTGKYIRARKEYEGFEEGCRGVVDWVEMLGGMRQKGRMAAGLPFAELVVLRKGLDVRYCGAEAEKIAELWEPVEAAREWLMSLQDEDWLVIEFFLLHDVLWSWLMVGRSEEACGYEDVFCKYVEMGRALMGHPRRKEVGAAVLMLTTKRGEVMGELADREYARDVRDQLEEFGQNVILCHHYYNQLVRRFRDDVVQNYSGVVRSVLSSTKLECGREHVGAHYIVDLIREEELPETKVETVSEISKERTVECEQLPESEQVPESPQEEQHYRGQLLRKTLWVSAERKSLRRNWVSLEVELRDGILFFYKNNKAYKAPMDLGECGCSVADDYLKHPFVFRVSNPNGFEYLFQADSQVAADEWMERIQRACGLSSITRTPTKRSQRSA